MMNRSLWLYSCAGLFISTTIGVLLTAACSGPAPPPNLPPPVYEAPRALQLPDAAMAADPFANLPGIDIPDEPLGEQGGDGGGEGGATDAGVEAAVGDFDAASSGG